jgi:hypothetical protein
VRQCRRYRFDPDTDELPLRVSANEDGGVSVGMDGLKTYACWHPCFPCGGLAVYRAGELDHVLRVVAALGWWAGPPS